MNKGTADHLRDLLGDGDRSESDAENDRWGVRVKAFLGSALGPDQAREFEHLVNDDGWSQHALRLGHIQGLIARFESEARDRSAERGDSPTLPVQTHSTLVPNPKRVFVVHGHDNEAKESAARFLERLELQPIVLHEQASSGRTVIEKFESYSDDIAFAVVLLTPDDVGAASVSREDLRPRARQNVIMELGYFLGRLGRTRVCALYKGGVELPSDYQGVLYIDMDSSGAWKTKLAQELVQAKLTINLNGLLGG